MQIADRFHLHQNILEAVKITVNSVIPVDVRITIDYEKSETAVAAGEPCKEWIVMWINLWITTKKVYNCIMQSMNMQKPDTANVRYLKRFIAAEIQ